MPRGFRIWESWAAHLAPSSGRGSTCGRRASLRGALPRLALTALLAALAGCRTSGGAPPPVLPVPQPSPSPLLLGHLEDTAVDESSGLVASRRNTGLLWTHNDSGDGPLLYCLTREAGTCGVWSVTGAHAVDWEDVAAGPGPEPGTAYLYVGDIGNNRLARREVTAWRVAEPAVSSEDRNSSRDAPRSTSQAEALRLRYPDAVHNAEALLVHPETGDLYVVTKEESGEAWVYRAAAPLRAGAAAILTHEATLNFPGEPPGTTAGVTGGDIAPDGRRVVLCTYSRGYELVLPPGAPFAEVWRQAPAAVPLGPRPQGEAVAYRIDGRALLAASEGVRAPLYEVVLRQG